MSITITNINTLTELADGLRASVSLLQQVVSDSDRSMNETRTTIESSLSYISKKRNSISNRIDEYRSALQKDDSCSPDDFEQIQKSISDLYDDLNQIADAYYSVNNIEEAYYSHYSNYKNRLYELLNQYIDICKKGISFLEKYTELLKESSNILSGDNMRMNSKSGSWISELFKQAIGGDRGSDNYEVLYQLPQTKQTWCITNDGSYIFDTPVETGEKLDSDQGKCSGFLGTCGLVSCVNILRMAGYNATENEIVSYAASTNCRFGFGKLCIVNCDPESNGGTSAMARKEILAHFGVHSELRNTSIEGISDAVAEGRGVIISVFAGMLYNGWSNHRDLHAITVTSVKRDSNGNIEGFYVCDSGTGGIDSSKYYTKSQIQNALTGRKMNVTSIIR